MITLNLNKVLWITVGCLLAVILHTFGVLVAFGDGTPMRVVALRPDGAWGGLFVAANSLLFVELTVMAGTVAIYNRQRPNDLIPERVLWLLALALIFFAAGSLAAIISAFVFVYPSWVACTLLAAISLGAAMVELPLAILRLTARQPLTELEIAVARLRASESDSIGQQLAISEVRAQLASITVQLGAAAGRTDDLVAELEKLSRQMQIVGVVESEIQESITFVRARLTPSNDTVRKTGR